MNPKRRTRLAVLLTALMVMTAACNSASTNTWGASTDISAVTTTEQVTRTISAERLVKESWPVNTLPEVVQCNGGPDYPNKAGVIDDLEPYPTPEGALFVFVQDQTPVGRPRFAVSGYIEMVERDGGITFGWGYGGGRFAQMVSLVEVDGQWAVDEWETSGC